MRIPRQRGLRPHAAPVVVLVPEERPSLTSRAAWAVGRWLWRHRTVWAPSGIAVGVFAAVAAVHVIAPWMVWVLAATTLTPAAGLWWCRRKYPEVFAQRPARLAALAALATAALGWAAGTVHFGPLTVPLAWVWLLLTATAQVFWLVVRRSH
ncbi:hypothetical protein [Streptomyces sp. NBC_00094]|uniref:hypothetical protein n=1 Tax=Streptomyces sp. NBC_00094 TaxID=2903620 RepID=UPI00225202FC|nr:hypothetical protein [Streptomyces sp. NBC_00094]MCX5391539.1 hypothetical protein [Streptomyces sp. NBC_00094]